MRRTGMAGNTKQRGLGPGCCTVSPGVERITDSCQWLLGQSCCTLPLSQACLFSTLDPETFPEGYVGELWGCFGPSADATCTVHTCAGGTLSLLMNFDCMMIFIRGNVGGGWMVYYCGTCRSLDRDDRSNCDHIVTRGGGTISSYQ